MNIKLGNIFEGDEIVVSQSPHGVLQNGQSMDLLSYKGYTIYAPIDGHVTKVYIQGQYTGGFHLLFGDYDILFHHARAFKTGEVKRGEAIGSYLFKSSQLHIHTAIRVGGIWDLLLNYTDRKIKLLPEKGGVKTKWTDWSTYQDKYIIFAKPHDMGVNIVYNVELKKGWHIRKHPSINSASIKITGDGEVYESRFQQKSETVIIGGKDSSDWVQLWNEGKAWGWINYLGVKFINPSVQDQGLIQENKELRGDMDSINKISGKWHGNL